MKKMQSIKRFLLALGLGIFPGLFSACMNIPDSGDRIGSLEISFKNLSPLTLDVVSDDATDQKYSHHWDSRTTRKKFSRTRYFEPLRSGRYTLNAEFKEGLRLTVIFFRRNNWHDDGLHIERLESDRIRVQYLIHDNPTPLEQTVPFQNPASVQIGGP